MEEGIDRTSRGSLRVFLFTGLEDLGTYRGGLGVVGLFYVIDPSLS